MEFQREEFYQANCAKANGKIKELTTKVNRLALFRLGVILLGGFALFQVIQSQEVILTLGVFILIIILFSWLVYLQSKVRKVKIHTENYLKVNENELQIRQDRSKNMYSAGSRYINDKHPYSSDLDIFGELSLYQLVNRSATVGGNKKLAEWLSTPANKEDIEARQAFAKELGSDYDFWQQIQANMLFNLDKPLDYQAQLSHFLSEPISVAQSSVLKAYVKVTYYIFIALFVGSFFSSLALAALIVLGVFNFFLSLFYARRVNLVVAKVERIGKALSSFSDVFESIEQRKWKNKMAVDMLRNIEEQSNEAVSVSIRNLSSILNRLDARLNMFVGAFLNITQLWDLKHIAALEEWRQGQSAGIPEAFEFLSDFEAIGSLTTLHFNNPHWAFPTINESQRHVIDARGIAHPFIKDTDVVANDYSFEDHSLALITGSNMAGKSTFLRTLGMNAVLAYTGAPVKAQSMDISVMHIVTYMRIRDSVNESTSTFKAELNRIKQVLEEVEQHKNVCFLLDELLRGTNSVDKYLGSKAIIEKLISYQGVGLVATHDLKLAELAEAYPGYVRNFHFDIQVKGEDMLFDYRLKDGACTIFNASMLLKKIGITI
ncbi:MutS-related protein [Albibacterium profundi]|uniref:FtsK/SpoIIIE domain-containing protein n=1 Tax=Albibacterium profundi TaxID=3134906 RepID=A0ABV5CC50_9SPHI